MLTVEFSLNGSIKRNCYTSSSLFLCSPISLLGWPFCTDPSRILRQSKECVLKSCFKKTQFQRSVYEVVRAVDDWIIMTQFNIKCSGFLMEILGLVGPSLQICGQFLAHCKYSVCGQTCRILTLVVGHKVFPYTCICEGQARIIPKPSILCIPYSLVLLAFRLQQLNSSA